MKRIIMFARYSYVHQVAKERTRGLNYFEQEHWSLPRFILYVCKIILTTYPKTVLYSLSVTDSVVINITFVFKNKNFPSLPNETLLM